MSSAHKKSYVSILFMIFGLAVVIVLIIYMWSFQQTANQLRKMTPQVPEDGQIVVIDDFYFNTMQNFSMKTPSDVWDIKTLAKSDTLERADVTRTVAENAFMSVRFSYIVDNDTAAFVDVGIVRQAIPRNARDFAFQILGETVEHFESPNNKISIAQQVAEISYNDLDGAYFMISLPETSDEKWDVWIVTVFVRQDYSYCIIAKTTETKYLHVRDEIQALIRSFRLI